MSLQLRSLVENSLQDVVDFFLQYQVNHCGELSHDYRDQYLISDETELPITRQKLKSQNGMMCAVHVILTTTETNSFYINKVLPIRGLQGIKMSHKDRNFIEEMNCELKLKYFKNLVKTKRENRDDDFLRTPLSPDQNFNDVPGPSNEWSGL